MEKKFLFGLKKVKIVLKDNISFKKIHMEGGDT